MEGKILTLEDLKILFRPLTQAEELKADRLIDTVYEILQQEAKRVGKDLQTMIDQGDLSLRVLQSVIADIVGRTLMTATNQEPVSQFTQSALGYSVSGTYLVPGGGIYVKKSELARLGLRRQRVGVMDVYGLDQGD
ncbi:Gp19/Gp15/Gp42 family protein [Ileibacterium valens]|uniref:Phage protein Gp19/Gp15/Gp42 n=1 Tax=Ileibacterium valens TaxID=1862668 RepID=A0A1U7NHW0_9FIRM|nr:Gp19/Gp15/Gp42 family protein [Ileibacterium valens]OLU40459.1 hypothetical protein BO224_05565 [Erysipelotrichaceae bacterium NYU-BL-E8]OLU41679.1 hypothetical protein BO222_02965 [Ileibacterium valens]OLU42883.1 hypothetical protein BM735_01450 [Erysipelotrichaceae bacterium NYU-BL-F16]